MAPPARLLRTYSRRGGQLRCLRPPDRWISPPQDRKRFFSSTSASSSAISSALSAASDDPDFSPPGKRSRQPRGKAPDRPWSLRSRAGKENRPPATLVASSPSPSPPRRRCPLLCSTPQWPPPGSIRRLQPRRRLRQAPPAELSSLMLYSPSAEGGSGPGRSLELYSPPAAASSRSALSPPHSPPGSPERRPGAERDVGDREPCPQGAGLEKSGRVLRASVRASWRGQAPPSLREDTSFPQAALPPGNREPLHSTPHDGAAPEEPCEDLGRDSPEGSSGCQSGEAKKNQLTPVVVLDPREVSMWLTSAKRNKKAALQPACQRAVSPLGLQGILENQQRSTKVVPGGGSSCRKACISGISASRWRKEIRLRPKRHKNKRQQQPNNSFFRPQTRQKGMKKAVQETSDCSFLNSFQAWGRVRASLSFHKKKKVTTDESFCNSIFCTPSTKFQLSGHQLIQSAGTAQCGTWSASSMILLAPSNSFSVLEPTLTDAEKVFGECHQEGPIAFEECIPLDKMKDCKKIGEGVFGEVFQIDSERGPVALKIIPIEGTEKVNGEAQKSFREILPETIISKELSLLSEESVNRTVGFISLYSVHCVQGSYPKYLLEAWDKYHEVTGSNNDRPDFFGDEQLFMVLEFEFGGRDLENMRNTFSSVALAKSVLHQVTASLAVAEQELCFEHRDLHWGNVLVKKTDVKELTYVLNGTTHTIPTAGIHVNIIDYTLSRLEKDNLTVFCDLSTDDELFQGTGDYQFDIYRRMKEENANSWADYHPHSNVLWLHYLSEKFLKCMGYKKKASTPSLRKIKQQLSKFHREVLSFESASDVLQNSSFFQ